MISSNKVITKSQMITTSITAAYRRFRTIKEFKDDRKISVEIVYLDATQEPISTDLLDITGANYDLLMSQSPDFAPGKPLDEYRELDLWYIVDHMPSVG